MAATLTKVKVVYISRQKGAPTERAAIIGAELERLGWPTPAEIVEAARDPASPLHPFFEWDTALAHDRYLIIQARQLVNSIKAKIVEEDGDVEIAPSFVAIPTDEEHRPTQAGSARRGPHQFVPITIVRDNPDMVAIKARDLRRALASVYQSYLVYMSNAAFRREFEDVMAAIEALSDADEEGEGED